MTRNTRTRRGTTIGVERLDLRISLSGFTMRPYAFSSAPTAPPTYHLPANPPPPGGNTGTIVNITPYDQFGLSYPRDEPRPPALRRRRPASRINRPPSGAPLSDRSTRL